MKKTFLLTHDKKKYARLVESAKSDIRKYIKREKKKALPTDTDYWDFDCKFGSSEHDANTIHQSEIDTCINNVQTSNAESFYIEVIAKATARKKA